MSFIIDNASIAGYLVGIGVNHKDGSSDFRWMDKPIHNKITSVGLDFLLTFDGVSDGFYTGAGWHMNQDLPRHAVMAGDGSYSNVHRQGACHFLKIGTDGSPSQFEDTDLKAPVGGLSSTKKTGGNYCGTFIDRENNLVLSRISHVSVAVSSDTTIREIGFFGRGFSLTDGSQVSEPMFSRIVLEQPIELLEGESITTCYELRFTHNFQITESNAFNGILDPDGNQLRCFSRLWIGRNASSLKSWGNSTNCSFWFNNDGSLSICNVSSNEAWRDSMLCGTGVGHYNQSYVSFFYSTSDGDFPADGSSISLTREASCSYEFKHYTGIGNKNKYRDINFILDFSQPGMSGASTPPAETFIDIKRFMLFGNYYRFGYYEDDGVTWHSQSLRKYANQKMILTHRLKFQTEDTL